jgi:hypothetical protein
MSIINKLLGHVGKRLKPSDCRSEDREFESRHARQDLDEERKIEEVIATFDEEYFHEAAKRYASTTAHMSFHQYHHLDYQLMLSMGRGLVPILLKDLSRVHLFRNHFPGFDPWCHMHLLCEFTHERPWRVGKDEGRYDAQLKAWVKWGKEKGYI